MLDKATFLCCQNDFVLEAVAPLKLKEKAELLEAYEVTVRGGTKGPKRTDTGWPSWVPFSGKKPCKGLRCSTALLQAPQWLLLVFVSTHCPPQRVCPEGQPHFPLLQILPPLQSPESRHSATLQEPLMHNLPALVLVGLTCDSSSACAHSSEHFSSMAVPMGVNASHRVRAP